MQHPVTSFALLLIIILVSSMPFTTAQCLSRDALREKARQGLEERGLPYTEQDLDRYADAVLALSKKEPEAIQKVPLVTERGAVSLETLLAINPITAPFYWGWRGVKKGIEWRKERDVPLTEQSTMSPLTELIKEEAQRDTPARGREGGIISAKILFGIATLGIYPIITAIIDKTGKKQAIPGRVEVKESLLEPEGDIQQDGEDFYQEFKVNGLDKVIQIKDLKKHRPLPGKKEQEIRVSTDTGQPARFISNNPSERINLVREAYELYIKKRSENPQTPRFITMNSVLGYSNNKKATRLELKIVEVGDKIIIHGYPIE